MALVLSVKLPDLFFFFSLMKEGKIGDIGSAETKLFFPDCW